MLSYFIDAFVLAIVAYSIHARAMDPSNLQAFLADIHQIYQHQQIIAYTCFNNDDRVQLLRHSSYPIRFASFSSSIQPDQLQKGRHFITFLVDFNCQEAKKFLENPEIVEYYQHPLRWIILGENLSQIPQIDAQTDSNILFVDKHFQMHSFYRLRSFLPYNFEYIGSWSPSTHLQLNHISTILSRRRKNLRKIVLKATIVITHNSSMNHLDDRREKHIDSIGKTNLAITKVLVDAVNGSLVYNRMTTWGYVNPKTGIFDGMIGELQAKRSDMAGTSTFLNPGRLHLVDYLSLITPTQARIIFRQPPLSSVANIYMLPFSLGVWLTGSLFLAISLFFIFVILKIKKLLDANEDPGKEVSRLSDYILMAITVMSQMGIMFQPKSSSTRITTIFMLILFVFLYTSYTANIVALLQSSSKTIATVSDLQDSHLQVGVDDTIYHRYFIPRVDEPIRRRLLETKILTRKGDPNSGRFLSSSEGMARVRSGTFALQIEVSVAYDIMEKTFYEHEKCNLQHIDYLQGAIPWYAIQKNSSFKEILKINLFKIREHGIQARENGLIYSKKPKCTASGRNVDSVKLQECYGAFVILAAGFGLSIVFMLLEKIFKTAKICLI